MSTFLHYVHSKDALLDCSAPGGERCESLTWVDEIVFQLSSLSYGAEFTIPEQQPMKSILHMIGQKLSNHNLGFQLQLLSVL